MIGGAALAGPAWAAQGAAKGKPAKASVYDRSVVIDAQGGIGEFDPKAKPTDPPSARVLTDLRGSGQTAISMTVGPVGNGQDRWLETIEGFAFTTATVAAFPDDFLLVLKGADIAAAKRTGRTGVICNLQDTAAIGTDLDRVEKLKVVGLRILQLTYNRRNISGDGSLEAANGGISGFGREMIAAINKNDLVLDLSHGGPRTQAEAIAESKAPPVISHTGCRDLVDNPRNTFDAQMKACADKGGVVGIYFMPFLREAGQPRAEDVIRHLEHAVQVCGEDHVGLGTDGLTSAIAVDDAYRAFQKKFYEDRKAAGIAAPGEAADVFNFVPEYNGPRHFETLAQDLSKRGWPDARIEKVLGANFARVFTEVWKG
jgi:membrane dipeptidase